MNKIFLTAIVLAIGFFTINSVHAQSKNIIEINRTKFLQNVVDYTKSDDWVFKGEKPAIIYFTASWCGPCKVLAPVLEDVAGEYKDKINVYKIDIDKERELAMKLNIRSVPTIIFSPVKGVPEVVMGSAPKQNIVQKIEQVLL